MSTMIPTMISKTPRDRPSKPTRTPVRYYNSYVRPISQSSSPGIFFSKDRREEVIEVEEEPEIVTISGFKEPLTLMSQGQWMKGCPEGGEQSFLFSLYTELSEGDCKCPQDCGSTVPRKKKDFFTIYVRAIDDCYAIIQHHSSPILCLT
jgi:hypothetical protein